MVHPENADDRFDIGHGRLKSLEQLVDGWNRHVERLVAEGTRHMSEDSPETVLWGVHDYAAALHLRDLVEGASHNPSTMQTELAERLRSADAKFISFTKKDLAGWLPRAIPEAGSRPEWWWRRIPKRGPVVDELRTFIAAVS
jgi:hypothetical protein